MWQICAVFNRHSTILTINLYIQTNSPIPPKHKKKGAPAPSLPSPRLDPQHSAAKSPMLSPDSGTESDVSASWFDRTSTNTHRQRPSSPPINLNSPLTVAKFSQND